MTIFGDIKVSKRKRRARRITPVMRSARVVLLTTLCVAAVIRLLGQLCLVGPDPVPEAAAMCSTMALIVIAAGLFAAGALMAFHLGYVEAACGAVEAPRLPWRSLLIVTMFGLALRGIGLECLHLPGHPLFPMGFVLVQISDPLLVIFACLVIFGGLN